MNCEGETLAELRRGPWTVREEIVESRSLKEVLEAESLCGPQERQGMPTGAEACEIYRSNRRGNAFCGGGLWQLYMHRHCEVAITRAEAARGAEYEWVVWSRFDARWVYPHIPLSFFGARLRCSTSTGSFIFSTIYHRRNFHSSAGQHFSTA